ncbi:receptor-like kinase [Trifolium pratense]|uniref:Receptor-like kinase n=1 Tax=Trifolium pratense TaxID=57577 RepID=A0A2K3K5K0_TRIPR|nr:receptor-like kinase [Trifolium pratense]
MREFNLVLLGKWCWRLLVDREGMWFRVPEARYGLEGVYFFSRRFSCTTVFYAAYLACLCLDYGDGKKS